jgi:SpoVK/Ycf46/Vps4 family AAA+-type ATPase
VTGGRSLLLTARLVTAPLDARRGIVRMHHDTLAALGVAPWAAVRLTGRRVTGALAAVALDLTGPDELSCDDLGLGNLGLPDGGQVTVEPLPLLPAAEVVVAGAPEIVQAVPAEMVRLALLGKVLVDGDNVSLLPQDVAPTAAADVRASRRALSDALGMAWTAALLTVVSTAPSGPRLVTAQTAVSVRGEHGKVTVRGTGARPRVSDPARARAAAGGVARLANPVGTPTVETDAGLPTLEDLSWLSGQTRRLREWLDLSFHHGPLLAQLGSAAQLGILVVGPEGSGRSSLVRAVSAAVGAAMVRLTPGDLADLPRPDAAAVLRDALDAASGSTPAVLLVEDVHALAPAPTGSAAAAAPLTGVLREAVARAVALAGVAMVGTSTSPEAVDPQLRQSGLLDKEISVPLPDRAQRRGLLEVLLRRVPLAPDVALEEIAARTPSFVTADLLALRREAAVRAALRQRDAPTPTIGQADLIGALEVVRATAVGDSTVDVPPMSLDDVGDMAETKQALTETVLWPLSHPDSFARLGIDPPRGVLLYGPPGCGKTFLVRALAGTGQANVVVVKGAELLSMWVGESERGVRELFRRARESTPTVIFLDEIDALAPARGQVRDSGVTDRVVAALLTELDGVEQLRDVVVVGATNRPDLVDPALLRPGRLERLIYVPPPDAAARAAILRAAAKNTPLAADVDLDALGRETDGYSAADCAALIREAALAAMRRSLDAPEVTAADVAAARTGVRPSLRAEQIALLAAYADTHSPG